MKKISVRIMTAAILVALSWVSVCAESYITQQDIDDGLAFCAQYPVRLILDEEEILFPVSETPAVIIKEKTLIPGRSLFEAMGGLVVWDEAAQTVWIRLDDMSITLTIGSNIAWVNGEIKTLDVPAMIIDNDGDSYGSTMIPVRFTAEGLGCKVDWNDVGREVIITSPAKLSQQEDQPMPEGEEELKPEDEQGQDSEQDTDDEQNADSSEQNTGSSEQNQIGTKPVASFWDPFEYAPMISMSSAARQKLMVIDIGHGGKDTGAIGHEKKVDELYEKTVNLKVSQYLKGYLQEAGANFHMIRETDVYYTLLERADKANSLHADVFVSIHNNSSEYDWPTGTEVHYYSKLDENGMDEKTLYGIQSKDIAQKVQDRMLQMLGTFDRGIKNSPKLAVLNKTNMPAIIIEGAFISNENNFEMMKTEEYAKRYAYATAIGLIEAMNEAYP